MNNSSDLNLAPNFVRQLTEEGFSEIGYYEIQNDNVCKIYVDKEAGNWEFSIYTFVSYADSGRPSELENAKVRLEFD